MQHPVSIAGQSYRAQALECKPVSFSNVRGQRLAGLLCAGQHGMVISCHGMLSDKGGTKHQRLAAELMAHGIGSLRFDFAGRGESEGDLWDLSFSREMEDLDAAINFVTALDRGPLGVFGSSMGGSVALLCAARDERIRAIATLAAVGHPDDIAERDPERIAKGWQDGYLTTAAGRISMHFVEDARQHNVVAAVGVIQAPLLVVHGERDEVVPVADAHDIATAARRAELEIVFGADHRFSREAHLRPTMRQVAAFFVRHFVSP